MRNYWILLHGLLTGPSAKGRARDGRFLLRDFVELSTHRGRIKGDSLRHDYVVPPPSEREALTEAPSGRGLPTKEGGGERGTGGQGRSTSRHLERSETRRANCFAIWISRKG